MSTTNNGIFTDRDIKAGSLNVLEEDSTVLTNNATLFTDRDIDIDAGSLDVLEEDLTTVVPNNTLLMVGSNVLTDGEVIDTDSFAYENAVLNIGLQTENFLDISPEQFELYSQTLNDSIGLMVINMDNVTVVDGKTLTETVPMFAHTANDSLADPEINMSFQYGSHHASGILPMDEISYEPFGPEAYNSAEFTSLKNKFGYEVLSDESESAAYYETEIRINNSINDLVRDIASGLLTTRPLTKTTAKLELTDELFQSITTDEKISTRASLSPSSAATTPVEISVPVTSGGATGGGGGSGTDGSGYS